MSKVLLITGATGKQGGATVNALLNSPQSKDFTILAVTRNPDSPSAKKLAEKGIKLVKGDLDDVPAIFAAAKEVSKDPIWGVFSIQTPLGSRGAKSEETRGKALVDEAVKGGVKMFVYTSVERGGDEKSFDNPTPIPHFISKYNIEKHLLEKAKEAKMDWCILRPVAFMDNFQPGFMGKAFSTMWKVAVKERPLQLIASSDIGYFAAQAFIHPDEYKGQGIGLAGDDISWAQAAEIYKKRTGQEMPSTWEFLANAMLWMIGDVGIMFNWFYTDGYKADVQALRKKHPGLLDWDGYLEKSGFSK